MPVLEMAGSEDSLRASWTPWPRLTIRPGVTDCATNMACSIKRSTRKANRKSPKIGLRYWSLFDEGHALSYWSLGVCEHFPEGGQ